MRKHKLVWRKLALNQLKGIKKYISKDSQIAADKIVANIRSSVKSLKTDPYLGQEEEILKPKGLGHRYLVCGNYKIIYRLIESDIYIAVVFDTRRNPAKLAKIVKK